MWKLEAQVRDLSTVVSISVLNFQINKDSDFESALRSNMEAMLKMRIKQKDMPEGSSIDDLFPIEITMPCCGVVRVYKSWRDFPRKSDKCCDKGYPVRIFIAREVSYDNLNGVIHDKTISNDWYKECKRCHGQVSFVENRNEQVAVSFYGMCIKCGMMTVDNIKYFKVNEV